MQQQDGHDSVSQTATVNFEGRLTFEEYLRVNDLIQQRQVLLAGTAKHEKKNKSVSAVIAVVVILLVLPLFALFHSSTIMDNLLHYLMSGVLAALGLFFLFLAYVKWFGRKRQIRKNWEMLGDPQLVRSGSVSEDRLLLVREYERVETKWFAFEDVLIDRDVLILTYVGNISQFLSCSWFASKEDWQTALTIIREHVSEIGIAENESPAASCTVCGKTRPKREMMRLADRWNCVECKPQAVQKLREGVD